MPFNVSNNRGTICDPIRFKNAANLTADNICNGMKAKAESMGIPMNVRTDTAKDGGLFGNTYPCVVISHPNPPQEYFTDVIVINGNCANFYFFGNSKANYQTNRANERKNSVKGMLLNAISGSNEMALQQEHMWHDSVIEVFESLTE